VIKFISDLLQVGGLSSSLPISSTNKTDRHDITEILLKVALNTIKPNQTKPIIDPTFIFVRACGHFEWKQICANVLMFV
jgi:hypothetical protein